MATMTLSGLRQPPGPAAAVLVDAQGALPVPGLIQHRIRRGGELPQPRREPADPCQGTVRPG
jgi:hypothetical protein